MENVIERAQASAWKLGSLRQRLPVVRTLMSIGDDHTAMPGQTSKSRISNSKSKDVKLQLSGSTRDPGMTQAEVIEVRKNFLLLSASVAFSGLAVLLKGSCVCVCVCARARASTRICASYRERNWSDVCAWKKKEQISSLHSSYRLERYACHDTCLFQLLISSRNTAHPHVDKNKRPYLHTQ